MINIFQPFEARVTALKQDKFTAATIKLTLYYIFSTAVILLVSSVAVLLLFSPADPEGAVTHRLLESESAHSELSWYEFREHLGAVLFFVDIAILVVVGGFSYFFARKTLLPIKHIHETQQQFMSDVAHDLRTPLSVMQVAADTILRKDRTIEAYKEFVTDIQTEAGRLTRLSNQLLTLLKNDKHTVASRQLVNLSHLIEAEAKRFEPYATANKVHILTTVTSGVMFNSNADDIVEILQNVLKNAIDYNRPGGRVELSLQRTETSIVMTIQDTGIGIAKEKQTKVFDRFVKSDLARSQSTPAGAGLGLSIVSTLVEKLRGRITLTSEPAIGTTVTMTFPVTHS